MTTETPRVETLTLKDGRQVAVREITGGGRVVVLCHPAAGRGDLDPDPVQTAARNVRLIGVDWPASGQAAADLAEVLDAKGLGPVGVVGWSAAGLTAAALAARRPDLVSRLVIAGAREPPETLAGDVAAKTLLIYAQSDPLAGPRHGRAWQRRIAGSRLETIPGASQAPIGPLWKRVLSFLAAEHCPQQDL